MKSAVSYPSPKVFPNCQHKHCPHPVHPINPRVPPDSIADKLSGVMVECSK